MAAEVIYFLLHGFEKLKCYYFMFFFSKATIQVDTKTILKDCSMIPS